MLITTVLGFNMRAGKVNPFATLATATARVKETGTLVYKFLN